MVGDELVFGAETTTVTAVHLPADWQDGYMQWDYVWFELYPPVSTEPAILAPTNWFDVVGDPSYNPSQPVDDLPVTAVYRTVKTTRLRSNGAIEKKGLFGCEGSGSPVGFRLNGRFVVVGDFISYGGQFARPDDIDIERGWGW